VREREKKIWMVGGMLDVGLGTMVSRLSLDACCCSLVRYLLQSAQGDGTVRAVWYVSGSCWVSQFLPPASILGWWWYVGRNRAMAGRDRNNTRTNETNDAHPSPVWTGVKARASVVRTPKDSPRARPEGEREVCAMAS
jgi:hypothetical protein